MSRTAKLLGIVPVPKFGYRLTWDDGFVLIVNEDVGLELLNDLEAAEELREDHESVEHWRKPRRHFSGEQIDEIERELSRRNRFERERQRFERDR